MTRKVQENINSHAPPHSIEYSVDDLDPWDGVGIAYVELVPGLDARTVEDFMIRTAEQSLGKLELISDSDNPSVYVSRDKHRYVTVSLLSGNRLMFEARTDTPSQPDFVEQPPAPSGEEFAELVSLVHVLVKRVVTLEKRKSEKDGGELTNGK